MTDLQTPLKKPGSGSLAFLLYGVYFIILWCIYFATTTVFIHLITDLTNSSIQNWAFEVRAGVRYGHGAALLLIATIAFFTNRFFIAKSYESGQITYDTGSRLWILRITILFASLLASMDIYQLIVSIFLGMGEPGQLNNVFVTLIAALGVVFFCLNELGQKDNRPAPLWTMRSILFLIFCITTIGIALYQEPPAKSRMIVKDREQLHALFNTANDIERFYFNQGSVRNLPKTLADLPVSPEFYKDSHTQKSFVYRVIDKNTFELCAHFNLNRKDIRQSSLGYNPKDLDFKAGESCLKKTLTYN